MLRILITYGAAFVSVFDRRFDSKISAYPKNTVVTHIEPIVSCKVISDPAVSLIWTFLMNLTYGISYGFV